jgi:hypothetical protein
MAKLPAAYSLGLYLYGLCGQWTACKVCTAYTVGLSASIYKKHRVTTHLKTEADFSQKIKFHVSLKSTLQRQNTEISKQIFPEKGLRGFSPNFHINASVSDLYMRKLGLRPRYSQKRNT